MIAGQKADSLATLSAGRGDRGARPSTPPTAFSDLAAYVNGRMNMIIWLAALLVFSVITNVVILVTPH